MLEVDQGKTLVQRIHYLPSPLTMYQTQGENHVNLRIGLLQFYLDLSCSEKARALLLPSLLPCQQEPIEAQGKVEEIPVASPLHHLSSNLKNAPQMYSSRMGLCYG